MSRTTPTILLAAAVGAVLAVLARGRLAQAPQAVTAVVDKRRSRPPRGVEEFPRTWVDTIGTPPSDGPLHRPHPEAALPHGEDGP